MNSMIKNLTLLFVALKLILPLVGFTQEAQLTIEVYENKFEGQLVTIQGLNQQKNQLTEFIRQNSLKIENLKTQKEISYLERQRLENLLKESQAHSEKITAIEDGLNDMVQENQALGKKLIQQYENEINKLLKRLEDKNTGLSEQKKIYAAIDNYREKKEHIQSKIDIRSLENIKINKLEISLDDTPKKIMQKADLLKDQEDKYRQLSQRLNTRKLELQKELKLRTRIDDLVTDLVLFDQQEESIANVESKSGQSIKDNETATDFSGPGSRGDLQSLPENVLVGPRDFNFNTLNNEELEDAIEILQKKSKQSEASADSLAKQAEKFYRAAELLKKNQNNL